MRTTALVDGMKVGMVEGVSVQRHNLGKIDLGVDSVPLSRDTVDEAAPKHLDNLSSLDWRSTAFYWLSSL